MRHRRNEYKRIKGGIWKARGIWMPVYVYDQQHAQGEEFQHYAMDSNGKLVYAGITRHSHMNQAQANQIHRVWRRWRNEYDTQFDGVEREYPARHIEMPVTMIVFPIDKPEMQERYAI